MFNFKNIFKSLLYYDGSHVRPEGPVLKVDALQPVVSRLDFVAVDEVSSLDGDHLISSHDGDEHATGALDVHLPPEPLLARVLHAD